MNPEKSKKVFLSDWELKRLNASGAEIALPENAIISPLSKDWMDYGTAPAGRPEVLKEVQRPCQEARKSCGLDVRANWRPGSPLPEVALRIKIAHTGRQLYALGFVPATDGNISVKLDAGTVLITPSGVSKGGLAPEDIAKIDMEGRLISGRKPSSEYLLHLCFYRQRPDVAAVVHAHPPLATGLASAGVALDKPLTSEMVISLGRVPLAQYATPGTTEVTDSIAGLVTEHNAIMLANHGVVTCGRDLETAFQRMETVEQTAKITLAAEQAGGGRLIPPEKLAKLEEIRRQLGL